MKFTSIQEQEICNLYKSGLTLKEVGNKFDVSKGVIKRILKINKITTRTQSQSMKLKSRFSLEQENEICKMYLNKFNPAEIAMNFNVSSSPIKRILKKNNIKLRSISESLRDKHPNEETRNKMRKAKLGKPSPMKGKKLPKEQREKHSLFMKSQSEKISERSKEYMNRPEIKIKMSKMSKELWQDPEYRISHSGENHPLWNGGSSFAPYCPKFNEVVKEEIRNKYNRKCIICNKDEKDNITKSGKIRKLSVHHIDYNKDQGCSNHEWRLIPSCISCHGKTNFNRNEWENKIKEILKVIDN